MSNFGINQVHSFSFSPNNMYAQEYYNAYRQLNNAKYKLENSNPDSKSEQKTLEKNFDYWNKKVPQISMKAKQEENRLESQQQDANNVLGNKIDYMA